MKIKQLVSKCDNLLISLGNKLAFVYLLIVLISNYEVLMRYAFNLPTTWVHETSLALAAMAMVYGGIYAYAKNKHIEVSVVVDLLPRIWQLFFALLADLIGFIYLLLLSISATSVAQKALFSPSGELRFERSGTAWNSIFPGVVKLFMCIAVFIFTLLILLHTIAKAIEFIDAIRHRTNPKKDN